MKNKDIYEIGFYRVKCWGLGRILKKNIQN